MNAKPTTKHTSASGQRPIRRPRDHREPRADARPSAPSRPSATVSTVPDRRRSSMSAPTRADDEAGRAPERVSGHEHDVGRRLDVRDRGERHPPERRRTPPAFRPGRRSARRAWSRSYQAKPAISATPRSAKDPSCQVKRAPSRSGSASPPVAADEVAGPISAIRLLGEQHTARAAQDPRRLGREVEAPAEHLGGRPVGDHDPVPEQHDPVGERGDELGIMRGDDHRARQFAQSARRDRPCTARSIPRVGSSRQTTARRAA